MAEIEIIPESIQLIKMTDDEYFSSNYSGYISNSKLSLIDPLEDGSIEKYKEGFTGASSPAFELGSAVHAMLLQPDLYTISDIRKPSGKLGAFAEAVFENRKKGLTLQESIDKASIDADYYSGKLSGTRLKTAIKQSLTFYIKRISFKENLEKKTLFLADAMHSKYELCMAGIANNKGIKETLYPTCLFGNADVYNEYAILADVYITLDNGEKKRLKLKAKLDNFTVNHETKEITLNDLKTSGKPVGFFMGNRVKTFTEAGEQWVWYDGSFQKFHYARQMGLYSWLMVCAFKHLYNINYKLKANIIVIETIPEYRSRVYKINNNHIKQGLDEFKQLLTLVANG